MLVDMGLGDVRCLAGLERRVFAVLERQAKEGGGRATLELGG